jgi:hypothetical protein
MSRPLSGYRGSRARTCVGHQLDMGAFPDRPDHSSTRPWDCDARARIAEGSTKAGHDRVDRIQHGRGLNWSPSGR